MTELVVNADALNGSRQLLAQQAADSLAQTADNRVLFASDDTSTLLSSSQNQLLVQRLDGSHIDDHCIDADSSKFFSSLNCFVNQQTVGDDCNVGACECVACENNCADECGANAVIDNIMSRRSIRKYKDMPVAREVMEKIAVCGINAPNGQSKQSWEVRVVENAEFQNEIKEVMALSGGERAAGCFYNAPVWVFIARDNSYDFSTIDCGLLAENMMLSANSLGVGSVCLGSPVRFILNSPEKDRVLSELGFSEGYELCLCIAFGYPDEAPKAKPRNIEKVRFID